MNEEKEKLGLPWVADSFNIFDDSGEIVMDRGCGSFADTEDFIIKAVNSHHALVEENEALRAQLDDCHKYLQESLRMQADQQIIIERVKQFGE